MLVAAARLAWTGGLALAVASTLILAACASPRPNTGLGERTSPETVGPKQGGYLRHLLPYSPQNLDPYTTEEPTGYGFIVYDFYEGLTAIEYKPGVDWRIDNRAVPMIAESWKQEADDTYLFNVRKGVRFHNGDSLNADDVVFSYKRFLDPNEKLNPATAVFLSNLASVQKVDDFAVRMTMKQPDPEFLANLAQRGTGVLPSKFVQSGGDLTKQIVGTGPFNLVNYRKDADGLAVRNAGYWMPGKPYLDGVKFTLRVDDSTMTAAFAAGEADILMRNDKNQFLPIQAINPKAQFARYVINTMVHVQPNVSKAPLNDVRVRRAIHLALDRDELNKAITFGDGVQTPPFVQAQKAGWSISEEELLKLPGYRQPKEQDITEAKRLMAEAGYPGGFDAISMYEAAVSIVPQASEGVQAQLKKTLGINLTLNPLDNPSWLQHRAAGDYDFSIDLRGGYLDRPATIGMNYFYSKGTFAKAAGISDPALDKLLEAQGREFEPQRRAKIFTDIQRLMLDKVYSIPLPQSMLYQIWQPWIHDWVGNMSARQTMMNPYAVWMDVAQAPANRQQR